MRLIDAEPIERELFKQADKSLAKNPYANAKICAFRRAFELVLNAPTIAPPPNDPMTLEELREMDGEPVWVECLGNKDYSVWTIVDLCLNGVHTKYFYADFDYYGGEWLAYRRKPKEALP